MLFVISVSGCVFISQMHISEYFMWVLTWLCSVLGMFSETWWWQTDFWYQMIKHNLQPIILNKFVCFYLFIFWFNWPLMNIDSVSLEDVLSLMLSDSSLFFLFFKIFSFWLMKKLRISLSKRLEHHWWDAGCHRSAPLKGLSLNILSFQFLCF